MKIVFLHGLGQTAKDWNSVTEQVSCSDTDCPEGNPFQKNPFPCVSFIVCITGNRQAKGSGTPSESDVPEPFQFWFRSL